jgi:Methyltransferase domain
MKMLHSPVSNTGTFSLEPGILREIFDHAKPLGHHEDANALNLGFGFLYYGLVRTLRPKHILVIGSGYGFSVVCLALGLKDNRYGELTFIDPSFSLLKNGPLKTIGGQAQWDDPALVRARFVRFGVESIVTHHRVTSEAFFQNYSLHGLGNIDLAFVDGNHAYSAVRHDFLAVLSHSHKNSYVLLHDTNLRVRELLRHAGVKRLTRSISRNRESFEIIDFPFSSGLAMVRVLRDGPWQWLPT